MVNQKDILKIIAWVLGIIAILLFIVLLGIEITSYDEEAINKIKQERSNCIGKCYLSEEIEWRYNRCVEWCYYKYKY